MQKMSNTELVTKPKELSKATLSLFNSIVKKSDDENAHKSNNQLFPQLSFINDKKIFYKVRDENRQPKINLKNLEWLIDTTRNTEEIERSHLNFMDNYALIFQKDASKSLDNDDYFKSKTTNVFDRLYNLSKADKNTAKLAQKTDTMDESKFVNEKSQKIMQKIEQEKNRMSSYEQERQERSKSIKKLRNLVKKYPFERSDEENNQIFEILCGFEEFLNLLPTNLRTDKKFLLEFASCAQFESVNLKLSQVFGHFGFHMVLKGSVRPLSIPHLYRYQMKLNSGSTPEPPDDEHETLNIGECFGTIVDLSGREITTKMFRVLTLEDKCEFLKLSTESYKKVSQRILEEEKLNKLNLFKSCPGYAPWPKHSLEELINFFEWRTFSPNTILTNEGFLSPFIGFIDEGECHVLRKVDVTVINKKTKASEKRVRQVVVGKLSKHESFGEISVLMKEPMTCTIVTESRCHIGIIPFEKATKLDNLTQRLFMQTATRTFATLTQKEIYRMYIDAEKKKMWKEYKNLVIDDTIEKYNITPGHGKYEMPKIETRFNKT